MTTQITQKMANAILDAAFAKAAEMGLKPLTVAILDAGGHLKALSRQDGTSTLRPEIAQGKARGAISMGLGSRALFRRAQEQPYFIQAMNALSEGSLVPVPGGVLARNSDGEIIGAVGITGDNSDNDEACAVAGIQAVGLIPDAG
jgi:uncharacterized protein GlcG (DUF336 family)